MKIIISVIAAIVIYFFIINRMRRKIMKENNRKLFKNIDKLEPKTLTGGLHHDRIYEKNGRKIPEYYKGKNGYMAKDVVANFDLSYNIGTAVTYLIRSKRKHNDGGLEDIKKAINHLHFELERLINEEKKS